MDVLGGACYDPLQSLNLSLNLLWVFLAHHVLLIEAAIVQAVGVVEEMLGLVVLERMGSKRSASSSLRSSNERQPSRRTSSYSSRRRLPRQEEQIPMTLGRWENTGAAASP